VRDESESVGRWQWAHDWPVARGPEANDGKKRVRPSLSEENSEVVEFVLLRYVDNYVNTDHQIRSLPSRQQPSCQQ
jgi:hypothetical protein